MENGNTLNNKKRKFQMPHIYVLLLGLILVCGILTWVLPAGSFDRVASEVTSRPVVVPGTYHTVERTPVGLFELFRCIYAGMMNAADVIMFLFVACAAIGLIISTGAFNGLVAGLLKVLKGKTRVVIIPIFITLIGLVSSTIGCFEEMFPFIPVFIGIAIAMGYDAMVGLGVVVLGTALGYSGAFMNPFTVGIAQGIAEVPVMSGAGFRIICHLAMIVVASIYVSRYAMKVQADPTKSVLYKESDMHINGDAVSVENYTFGWREKAVLGVMLVGIIAIVYGTKKYGWFFEELCAVFLIMGLVSSFIMGWSFNEIAEKVAKSFTDMAMACMIVGLARGILMVLEAGNIIDTVVYALSIPLGALPRWLAAEAMLIVQTLLNFLIPSGSGQATVSMPIMTPLADLLNIPRQVAVLAFQFGDGLSNIMWPTAMTPVICGVAGIKMEKWWKWFAPLFLMLVATQMVLIGVALAIGWGV